MAHRNRTLMMVVSLIWIVALLGAFISAQARSGGEEHGDEGEHSHSALMLVEAPAPQPANHSAATDLFAPAPPA